ncbi:hypothetical protein BJ742DRAFT_782010 [Cladochytrium replicatum]|nr:hypothetical protein BJ742DRAFT_782010 [Cladochytrium replicatum]
MNKQGLYTIDVPGAPDIPGEGKPRKAALFADDKEVDMIPGIANLYDNFLHGVKVAGNDPFMGIRPTVNGEPGPYVWQTYNEIHQRIKDLAAYYKILGLDTKANVGLFSINRPEWIIGEQASFYVNMITVPLYDTLGVEAIEYIVTQTSMSVVVATSDKAKTLVGMRDKIPTLKTIIVMDEASDELVASAAGHIKVIGILDAEKEGRAKPVDANPPASDDVATICYTSGTTGLPKGVMMTHRNMLGFPGSVMALIGRGKVFPFTKEDVHISYLPLAHVFEREVQIVVLYVGGRIGFYQGDTLKLLDDVAVLKPTLFASVPRLYNRIYDKVLASVKAKGGLAAYLFNAGFQAKKKGLAAGNVTHFLWDRLVFGNVRARLGGRVKVMMSGAAPISADVVDFLRICFSTEFHEGYGQTETCAAISITDRHDLQSGHVGVPLPCLQVKLIDVPAMDYTSKDKPFPRGEIALKGTNVFPGYYNSPEKTAEAFTPDGWLRTGDIGQWDSKGRLQIVDRVKNIFKLAQGEYIAPEKIENVYIKHELVAQAFVYGDSLQAQLVAIIVPDEETFVKWADGKFGAGRGYAKHAADDAVRKALCKELEAFGKKNDLKGFENIKALYIDTKEFSMENGLFTPTFKLKRHEAKKYYETQIAEMYAELTK